MNVRQRFFELLDNISMEGVDITIGSLIFFMIVFVASRYGKKDNGKTIFDGSNHRMEKFDKKDENKGFI